MQLANVMNSSFRQSSLAAPLIGRYFEDYAGSPEIVVLLISHGMLYLRNEHLELAFPISAVDASRGLTSGPSLLRLPNGKACEIEDEAKFRAMLVEAGVKQGFRSMLREYGLALLLGVLICAALLVVVYELTAPWASRMVAAQVPVSWIQSISSQVMAELDNTLLTVSSIPEERQDALRSRFASWRAPEQGAPPYNLLFRKGNKAGAQSFALPSGEIVVTDELVALAANDSEVLAIVAHQLGHQYYKHGVQGMTQHALFRTMLYTYFEQKQTCVNSLATALLNYAYSTDEEEEASQYARNMLQSNGLPSSVLSDMQRKLKQAAKVRDKIQLPALLYSHELSDDN